MTRYMGPRWWARGLSGRAAAAANKRRAWTTSKWNGRRPAVTRRRRTSSGETDNNSWMTAQSRKQRITPRRWLKLRGRHRGREARKVSSEAAVSWSRSRMPPASAKRTRSRSSCSSLMYLRPTARRCFTNRSAAAARFSLMEDLLSISEGDLAERLDGHFAVDLRRSRRPRADKITDLLQREVGVDEPLHEGVAQRVGPWPMNLDPGPQQITCCACGDRGESDRSHRRWRPEEHVTIHRFRPAVLEILDDRLADGLGQRERGRVPCLTLRHREPLTFPIDIVEGQSRHLTTPKAVGHQQQHDRVIPFATRGSAVDASENSSDLGPRDRPWDARQPIHLRPLHGVAEITADQPFAVHVAQEDPQHPAAIAYARLGQPGR